MFQDTLLIIKPDYLAKRKTLLLHLLQQGFFIKGQRKLCFTPELAAEFYQDLAEDRCFMFQVILLSKGNSEAFILAKECAVENLINDMVCYFNTSTEMEQNIHVTKCLANVQREISFIFPNYISEPIYCPEQIKFCNKNPLVETTLTTLYDIVTNPSRDPHKSWKEKLAESLILKNSALPYISNQCCYNLNLNVQDIAQQTKITCFKHEKEGKGSLSSDLELRKDCHSLNITSSSCISCSTFDSNAADCIKQTFEHPFKEIIKARTAPLTLRESSSSSTLKTEQEGGLDDWITEEHEIFEDVTNIGNALNLDRNAPFIPTTEHEDVKEIHEMESLPSITNKELIDDISAKLEINSIDIAEKDNKQAEKEVLKSDNENVIVSAVEDKQSGAEISVSLDENKFVPEEEVRPSTT